MSVLADPSLESTLTERILPSREHVPDDPAPEDTVGAVVAGRHLLGVLPSAAERAVHAEVVTPGKAPVYGSDGDPGVGALVECGLRFDEHRVVRELDGQRLSDVAD